MGETVNTKSRISEPANVPWLDLYQRLLGGELETKLRPDQHGTICLEITVRAGLIQGIRNVGVTTHRP